MSTDFIIRLIGMVAFSVLGAAWGTSLGRAANLDPTPNTLTIEQYAFIIGLVGALAGLILTPLITIRPIRSLRNLLGQVSAQTLLAGLMGLVVGLIIATLLALPLSQLPSPFSDILPLIGVLVFGYLGVSVFVMRQHDLFMVIQATLSRASPNSEAPATGAKQDNRTILLDTSVIIDGRIADIARTGFIPGSLLIPRFVLNELQFIADSSDGLRRQRGRRGMEVLASLQKEPSLLVRLSDIDVEGVKEVDDKLVI
ncbi:MAG: PIN domain nuclease, partial [Anaerolineae bacterium]|nr:PIN domain nuclease [Anaerolineae bacterium]